MSAFKLTPDGAFIVLTYADRRDLRFHVSELADLASAAQAALAKQSGDESFPQPVRAICPERRMSMDDYLHDADEELQMYEDRDKG